MQSTTIILIKQSKAVQLGHLYEHLYCGYLEKFFNDHQAYPYLDYKLTGRTYYNGTIYIECTFYTEKALKLIDSIKNITIDFSEESIYTHFSQIIAERHVPFGGLGIKKITDALKKLDEQPWQDIDSYGYTDFKHHRTQTGPVYITEGDEWTPKKVYTNIYFDMNQGNQDRHLLPVFRQLALFINASLQRSLPFEFGYFSQDDSFAVKPKQAIFTNTFYLDKDDEVDIEEVSNVVSQSVKELLNEETLQRFTAEFKSISYRTNFFTSPDVGLTYEDTLFIVGAEGWSELFSSENLDYILKRLSLSVRYGNKISKITTKL